MRHLFLGLLVLGLTGCFEVKWGDAETDSKICLTGDLHIEGAKPGDCFEEAALDALLDQPVSQGPNKTGPLEMTHPDDYAHKEKVWTCREFFARTEEGYYAMSRADMAREAWYKRACGTVLALTKAAAPQRSFLTKPDTGLSDPSAISVRVLPSQAEAGREELVKLAQAGLTLADMAADGDVDILAAEKHKLHLTYKTQDTYYEEVARGDLDHDGLADMLLFMGVHSERGTMAWYETIALTRKRPRGLMEAVPLD